VGICFVVDIVLIVHHDHGSCFVSLVGNSFSKIEKTFYHSEISSGMNRRLVSAWFATTIYQEGMTKGEAGRHIHESAGSGFVVHLLPQGQKKKRPTVARTGQTFLSD